MKCKKAARFPEVFESLERGHSCPRVLCSGVSTLRALQCSLFDFNNLVNVGRFLADDGIGQEVGAELHRGAAGADVGAFGGDGQVGVFTWF